MSFRDDSQLDPSEVRDERGRGGLGGGFGGGRIAVGGGGLGIGVIIVILLLQVLGGGGGLGQLGSLQDQTASGPPAGDLSECRTGADANARQDCRIVGYVNSVQRFWKDEFARRGRTYVPAVDLFRERSVADRLRSGEHGRRPVLLPGRQARLHRPRLPRRAARPLRRHWAVARAGLRDRARVRPPRAGSPRHAGSARQHDRRTGHVRAHRAAGRLLRGRVGRARDADRPAGADHAGSRSPTRSTRRQPSATTASSSETQGQVDPDTWTHGSSAQRKAWFTTGYQTGDMTSCDTFGGAI